MFTFPSQWSSHADPSLLHDKFQPKFKPFHIFHLGHLRISSCTSFEGFLFVSEKVWRVRSQPGWSPSPFLESLFINVYYCMWISRGADLRKSPPCLHRLRWNQGKISLKTSMDHQLPTSTIYTSPALAGYQEEAQQWMPSAVALRNAFYKLRGLQFASLLV